jgi:hypothetical protein
MEEEYVKMTWQSERNRCSGSLQNAVRRYEIRYSIDRFLPLVKRLPSIMLSADIEWLVLEAMIVSENAGKSIVEPCHLASAIRTWLDANRYVGQLQIMRHAVEEGTALVIPLIPL